MDYVLALGGSIICPDSVNCEFLNDFQKLIKKKTEKGDRFIVITGGGDIARHYQDSARKVGEVPDKELDWIGVYGTYLNARLIRGIFSGKAHPEVIDQRFKVDDFGNFSILVGSGWEPGRSTDYVATQTAIDFDIEKILILSKESHVYSDDPAENEKAKPMEEMTWDEYIKIIPDEWSPGLKTPVDPVAARLAKNEEKNLVVADGRDIDNLQKILSGDKFNGTTIKSK